MKHLLFPTPIFLTKLENTQNLNERLINDSFEEIDEVVETRTGINGTLQSRTGLENIFDSFKELADLAYEASSDFLEEIGLNSKLRFNTFWCNNICEPGSFHIPHMHGHGGNIFVGVYYPCAGLTPDRIPFDKKGDGLRVTEYPKPGDLMLFDPAGVERHQLPDPAKSTSEFYGRPYAYTPETSALILFPHYLMHMVVPLKSDESQRLSIAFSITR